MASATTFCDKISSLASRAKSSIVDNVSGGARHVSEFFTANRDALLTYTLGWAALFTCLGLLYGFRPTVLPLAIGTGCGAGFGILLGVITYKFLTPNWVNDRRAHPPAGADPNMPPSLYGLMSHGIYKLDAHGTRWLLLTVMFTVILTFTKVFPLYMGIIAGVIAFNQLAVRILYKLDFDKRSDTQVQKESIKAIVAEELFARGLIRASDERKS